MPDQPTQVNLDPIFKPTHFLDLYRAGRNEELADRLLDAFKTLDDNCIGNLVTDIAPDVQQGLDRFVGTFLFLLTQPDFIPAEKHGRPLLWLNPLISNLVAASSFRTTDPWVTVLWEQRALGKMLILLNCRCSVQVDYREIFDADATLASAWFGIYATSYRGAIVSEVATANLQRHLSYTDPRLNTNDVSLELIFGSTYVGGAVDRKIKQTCSRHIREMAGLRGATVRSRPNPKKVAVISDKWKRGHSVYRTLRAYVAALRPEYHVTLVKFDDDPATDTAMFDEVRTCGTDDKGAINFAPVMSNEWAAVYYPDIGMSMGSVLFSALRLAPVQLVGTGHPVSTWGSEIDYFVSGEEVEAPGAESHYSERLILLPGMGAIYDRPTFEPKPAAPRTDSAVHIACSWYGQKVNHKLLATVAEIVRRSTKPLHFHVFSGVVPTQRQAYVPFQRAIREALRPATVTVYPSLAYADYMQRMSECDLGLDCFHFGGSNTVSDLLHLRKPVVCMEGTHWYGRIGAALLRRAGQEWCVARNEREYVDRALGLIVDEGQREQIAAKLRRSDLAAVYSADDAPAFKLMLDCLIEHHQKLRRSYYRGPIRIVDSRDSGDNYPSVPASDHAATQKIGVAT